MAAPRWMIEFGSSEAALAAARALREQGHAEIELYSPYELEEADEALGLERPRALPRGVLIGGLVGAATAYLIQWYVDAISYPINVGGRPLHSAPAFVPVTFEGGVLFGAFAAFLGLLVLARMPRLWRPVFEVEGFEGASLDRFWVAFEAEASAVDADGIRSALGRWNPLRIERSESPS